LVQIEQLHAVTIARSVVHSNRTWPQWHPPVYVLISGNGLAPSVAAAKQHPVGNHHGFVAKL
jgi:hypothetical protein